MKSRWTCGSWLLSTEKAKTYVTAKRDSNKKQLQKFSEIEFNTEGYDKGAANKKAGWQSTSERQNLLSYSK